MKRTCKIAAAVQVIGYVIFGWGMFGDGRFSYTDATILGASMVVGSLSYYLASRNRIAEDVLIERARQAGYDAGYADGRKIAKPVTVPRIGISDTA